MIALKGPDDTREADISEPKSTTYGGYQVSAHRGAFRYGSVSRGKSWASASAISASVAALFPCFYDFRIHSRQPNIDNGAGHSTGTLVIGAGRR